ncbi:MAG: hypothetical protein IKA13_02110 [Bacteroidales bacterium]|nr:hypothetical protein [Bacteroidales bacterium]
MKSFFTNLGKLLLCGATVAMIGCTDLHSDLLQVEQDSKKEIADLQSTLDQLEAKLDADYALKSELEQVKAQIADEKAALEAAIKAGDEAAIAAAKADLDAAVAQVTTEIAGIYARLEALEASTETEEIAAQLAALDAYVLAMEEAIVGRLDTIEQALSAVTVLLEDEAAARQYEDEMLAKSIEGLQENLTSVINLVNDLQSKEYVTAEELYEVYGSIETTNTALSSVLLQLQDLAAKHDQDVEEIYAKINVVEEALSALVFTVTDVQTELDAQVAALEAIEGYIQELYLADNDLQENLTQLLNVTQDQLDELYDFQNELYSQITTLQQFCTQMINSYETADQELLALIMETKAELSQTITFLTNLLNDYTGQIDDLAARVQSLVFIPEYSDGKATIEWGLLIDNDSAVNFLLNNVLTAGNIDAAKDLVKSLIADVKDVILGYTGNLEDDVNAFLDGIINEPAIETAFKDLFNNLQTMIEATVLEYYYGLEYGWWVDFGGATPEELAAQISADILAAFNINDLDLTSIVKSLLGDLKAQGIATAKDLINKLKSVSLNDIVAQLNSDEFHGLLSKIFSTVKGLEAKVLENTALLKKESVIRYKVLGQNATALAAAIAANPSVLSYDVEAVDVRAAAPGLEITKVAAKGDEIHVTVVPQNFHYRFYLTYILEDSFLYGAAESFFDKMDKTGLISYSAALVLNDGNNIRSTEYTNFVSAENPEIFTPEVIKNGAVVEHETITAVKGQVDEITLCEGMYMGYLSVPNRVILTKEQLEAKGYFGFTEKAVVKTNNNGIAGPCQFEGLTGTVKAWNDYTFTTYWSVNDIVLAVNSDLVWSLPESVVVWEGAADANDNQPISVSADDIAAWFGGLAVGQRLHFEFEVPTSSVACIHMYNSNDPAAVEFFRTEQYYAAGNYYLDLEITPALLDVLTETDEIVFAGSGFVMKSITLYL